MTVYAMHGIVEEWSPFRQVDRNYVSRDAFDRFLTSLARPFTDWHEDAEADSDILTVDDSTMAGAAACFAARARGHAVTFFVNGLQVERREPYYFSVLDAHLDARNVKQVKWDGMWYPLETPKELKRFRVAVRDRLVDLTHDAAHELTRTVASALGSEAVDVPLHLAPATIATLKALKDAGVRIENHGWDHTSIRAMTVQQFRDHVERAQDWLGARLQLGSLLYAVPYGYPDLTPGQRSVLFGRSVTLDEGAAAQSPGAGSINRKDLTGTMRRFE